MEPNNRTSTQMPQVGINQSDCDKFYDSERTYDCYNSPSKYDQYDTLIRDQSYESSKYECYDNPVYLEEYSYPSYEKRQCKRVKYDILGNPVYTDKYDAFGNPVYPDEYDDPSEEEEEEDTSYKDGWYGGPPYTVIC